MNLPVTLSVTRTVDAPADALWQVLRTGRDMHLVLPDFIRTCRVDGEGEGARRVCGTDGGDIEETVLSVDDEARLFRYRIDRQSLMPIEGYEGTVHVVGLDRGRAHVLWFASYALLEPAAADEVAGGLRGLLDGAIRGLVSLALEVA